MKLSEGNSTESRYNSFTCVVSHLGAVDVKLDMQAGPFTSLVKLSIHLDSCQERVFHVKRPENNKTFISYLVFVSAVSNRPIRHTQNLTVMAVAKYFSHISCTNNSRHALRLLDPRPKLPFSLRAAVYQKAKSFSSVQLR